jgi:hypothetical protein
MQPRERKRNVNTVKIMKLVIMMDGSTMHFDALINTACSENKSLVAFDTHSMEEKAEFKKIINKVKDFSKSSFQVMLIRYSGREAVYKEISDECTEMIVCFSDNKNSRHYIECPANIFLDLINVFKKEN